MSPSKPSRSAWICSTSSALTGWPVPVPLAKRRELARVGLRDLVLIELDGHDGDGLGAAVGTRQVDEEEAVALGEDADASGLIRLPAGGAPE